MFHKTLSRGKHIAQEKEQGILFEPKWKGQEQSELFEPRCKGQEKYCRSRSKDRVTNHLYVY